MVFGWIYKMNFSSSALIFRHAMRDNKESKFIVSSLKKDRRRRRDIWDARYFGEFNDLLT